MVWSDTGASGLLQTRSRKFRNPLKPEIHRMGDNTTIQDWLRLKRFLTLALPYWKLMALTILAMTVTSALSASLLLLSKPVFEGFTAEDVGRTEAEDVLQEEEAPVPGTDTEPSGRWEEVKERVEESLTSFAPVRMIREAVAPGAGQLRRVAYLVLLIVTPLWIITAFLETYCSRRMLACVIADLRIQVFEKLSRLPLSFYGGRKSGDLISRVTNDISSTKSAAKMLFSKMFKHPIELAALLSVAFYSQWHLTLIALVFAPPIALVARRYGRKMQKQGRKVMERTGDVTDALNQFLSGIRVVKAFGMEEEENQEFRKTVRRQLKRIFKRERSRAWSDSLPHAIVAIAFGVIMLIADRYVERGALDLPSLIPFIGAVALMPHSVKKLTKTYTELREKMAAFERIYELTDADVTIHDHPDATPLAGVEQEVAFNGVWFAYQDEDYVLKDIDFRVPAGSSCALVGETGAGKSTLLDLIPRFYDPQRGSITIDGRDIKRIKRRSLLDQIAIVGQHPFLFNRSVAENIRYGKRDATQEEIIEAATAANIHETVANLPQGYDTLVGEGGGRFSGGQRQCITIARALLKNAPILILDEATSSLDSDSERMVQEAIGRLLENRTVFVIAHRLSTVRFVDKIVVLKGGEIVETGTHGELLERDGEYARFHRIQFGN